MAKAMSERYKNLISDLLAEPDKFESEGKGNYLLEEHFNGAPVKLLRPILVHRNTAVRRTAMFVANELGHGASELIDDIVPLITDADIRIQWDALESVMICSTDNQSDRFIHIVREIDNQNSPICRLAMRLVSRSKIGQLQEAKRLVGLLKPNHDAHQKGLQALIDESNASDQSISIMLDSDIDVVQKYGAIIASRMIKMLPDSIRRASNCSNKVVAQFACEALGEEWSQERCQEL